MKRLSLPTVILVLILLTFFCKGVFLSATQPIFTGQDEARHYNSIQLIAEPYQQNQKPAIPVTEAQNKDDLSTYRFSEEIRETARITDNQLLRSDIFNTIRFSGSSTGLQELRTHSQPWSVANDTQGRFGPDAVRSAIFYHQLTASIERFLGEESILVRFHAIRIFSVLLGTLAVFLAYLTARTIGFPTITSLIITALIAFQPKFTLYFTNINYDTLLIPMFFLFTYAGARTIRNGLTITSFLLFGISIVVATLTKATGYLLILATLALCLPFVYQQIQKLQDKRVRYTLYGLSVFLISLTITLLYLHFFNTGPSFLQTVAVLGTYLAKTFTPDKILWPSETYWGMIGWTKSWAIQYATLFIFIVELVATIGLLLILFSRRFKENYPSFLPAKKQLLFLFFMVLILQAGVRFADWNAYVRVGGMAMSLGTPGRYFLPTLLPHILLLVSGLGAFLAYFKKESYFHTLLTALLILMIALMLHLTLNVITPRYYF